MREAVRIDAFALDEPALPNEVSSARAAAVDEHHRAPALLQVQRDADADDAGAEDDGIARVGEAPQARSSPSVDHSASTRALTAASISIGRPHSRVVSPGHLFVASMPILLPSPDTGEAKSR